MIAVRDSSMSRTRWQFTVPFSPEPKRRPRVSFHGGKAQAFTPPVSKRAEDRVRMAVSDQLPAGWVPLDCAVRVTVTAYRSMPNSIPKKRRDTALPTTRPDVGNYAALVMDALNDLVYTDDGRVVELVSVKAYADDPRWDIVVEALE